MRVCCATRFAARACSEAHVGFPSHAMLCLPYYTFLSDGRSFAKVLRILEQCALAGPLRTKMAGGGLWWEKRDVNPVTLFAERRQSQIRSDMLDVRREVKGSKSEV
jgi:hypothetical protein